MLPKHNDGGKLYLYQLGTLGFYFFYWCKRSKAEINQVLGRSAIPTMWWFILPFGNFWWMWQYANVLDTVSQRRIKLSDTYAFYLIATCAAILLSPAFRYITPSDTTDKTFNHYLAIFAVALAIFIWIASVLGHAFFCSNIQHKINQLGGNTPATPAVSTPPTPPPAIPTPPPAV